MRWKICEAVNSNDGRPIFYIYKSVDGQTWSLVSGTSTEIDARQIVNRLRNPVPERVIEEFEG